MAEEHVIPLLADAVPPAHPTKNATTTAPNGRTATATDAGLHRIDTARERSAAGSTTEIVTVLATDGGARQTAAQTQPPVNEKPLTIVVIPSDVARVLPPMRWLQRRLPCAPPNRRPRKWWCPSR